MRPFERQSPIIFLGIILLSLGLPHVATAQDPTPSDDEVNAIAKQLYCPVCENVPLDACGTQACIQWRGIIRDKLAEGWTEDEIKQYFVDQYGDRVLAEPPRRGLNWLAYIVPPAAFLAGVYLLYKGFQTWKTPSADHASPQESVSKTTAADDKYISRLEEELRNR